MQSYSSLASALAEVGAAAKDGSDWNRLPAALAALVSAAKEAEEQVRSARAEMSAAAKAVDEQGSGLTPRDYSAARSRWERAESALRG